MDKDLLEQCQKWQEEKEYSKVIKALEKFPIDERTPEMDLELARAYNNRGRETGYTKLFKKALALLFLHEDYFKENHLWHYRVGYAFFQLEQDGRALPYFRKALELKPDDEETEKLIFECNKAISLPLLATTFAKTTKEAWQEFEKQEPELFRIFKEKPDWKRELPTRIRDIFDIAFDQLDLGVYQNGSKLQLILSPDGEWMKFFELAYFQAKAPESIKKNWEILIGRQPQSRVDGVYAGYELKGEDIRYWLDQKEDGSLGLAVLCEKLTPLHLKDPQLGEDMLLKATEKVIGELPRMKYVSLFHTLKAPQEGMSRPITELGKDMESLGFKLSLDPQTYLEDYGHYDKPDPEEKFNGEWRTDVVSGNTSCADLVLDYENHYDEVVNALMADKAIPGFFCLPMNNFEGKSSQEQILQFLHELESTLLEKAGPDAITITGDALGKFCSYVDFIAWDLPKVMQAAVEYFKDHDLFWAGFHVFHSEAKTVIMCKAGDEVPGMGLVPPTEDKKTIH